MSKLRSQLNGLLEQLVKPRLKKGYAFSGIDVNDSHQDVLFTIHTKKHDSGSITLIDGFDISEPTYTCTMHEIGGAGDEADQGSGAYQDVNEVFEDVEFMESGKFSAEEKLLFYKAQMIAFKLYLSNQSYQENGGLYFMNLNKEVWCTFYQSMKLLKKEGEIDILEWCPERTGSKMFTVLFVYEAA